MKNIKPKKTDFIAKINEISGQNVGLCFQCGTCSGTCPNAAEMDMLPRQVMRRSQIGLGDDVKAANTAWICASCLSCTTRCPRGIDIARMMEAIRLLTLRENIDYVHPDELPGEMIEDLPQMALISSFRKHTA